MVIDLGLKYMKAVPEKTEAKSVGGFVIKTDRFNSTCASIGLGDFTLILPGNSLVRKDSKITIERLEEKTIQPDKDFYSIIYNAVKRCGDFDGVMVSGGIDSSIIAAIGLKVNKDCDFIVGGFKDSEDVKYA